MESYYGIGVQNRYEMFYDDESDPLELLKKKEAKNKEKTLEKENKTKEKPKETPKKTDKTTNGTITEKRTEVNHKEGQKGEKKEFKKTERVRFADREERNNQRNTVTATSKTTTDSPKEVKEGTINQRFNGESRGRGRGGIDRGTSTGEFARGRGNRRGRGTFSERGGASGKREFDRQSGNPNSSVKPFDKKDGAGSYNWGSDKEQINFEDPEKRERRSPEKGKEQESETKENDSPKEEEEPKEMTLDEYKALHKRDRPQFNVRKAGEGENNDQWKTTYVLNKKKTEEAEDVAGDSAEPDSHQGKRKVLLPIDFQFTDGPMRGRFRGRGRGGPPTSRGGPGGRGRGSRGGGGGRFSHNRPEAPKMDDEKMFPSLG